MAEPPNQSETGASQAQPGQVIAPGSNQPAASAPVAQPQPPVSVSTTPELTGSQQSQGLAVPQSDSALFTQAQASAELPATQASNAAAISWTASEFVAHEKSAGWYGGLLAITVVIAGLVYLVTRDIISTVVVLAGAAALGILASRKPKQLQYHLDAGGIAVGQKRYDYGLFRSFAVVPEGAFSSIVFMPLKRFAQTTTIYYAPEDEDKIISVLSDHLPFEEHKADPVDNLMRRIRF